MKKISLPYFWLILFLLPTISHAQHFPKIAIDIANGDLMVGIDNCFTVIAQQERSVVLADLKATFFAFEDQPNPLEISERYGCFYIQPPSIGWVEIHVVLKDTVEVKTFGVKPITAVGALGRFRANEDKKISVGEFKAQMGLMAIVECCGFDARCKVTSYEVIRISARGEAIRVANRGARFTEETRAIIDKTTSGDLYVFRKIRYRCPRAIEDLRLEDMTFEIE